MPQGHHRIMKENEDSPVLAKIYTSKNFNDAGLKLYLKLQSASLISIDKEIIPDRDNEIEILKNDIPKGLHH